MRRMVTPAVVLRTVDYGEADRVVTLLTRDGGKLSAIASAARKSNKRFGAGLSLFGVGQATLTSRPSAELYRLESFHGASGFPHLMADVAKVAHGAYACELVRELSAPGQPDPGVFELLVTFLSLLDQTPARAEMLRVFELRLLGAVGLRPQIEECVRCSSGPLDEQGQVFELRRGGVVCGGCVERFGPPPGRAHALDGEARRALEHAQRMELAEAAALTTSPPVNVVCRELLAALVQEHLGRPLKSLEFIAKMNRDSNRSHG